MLYAGYLPEGVDVRLLLHRDAVAGETEHEAEATRIVIRIFHGLFILDFNNFYFTKNISVL